jgi:hypothetical protein
MNKLYAQRHGMPVDSTKRNKATRAVDKLIERDRQNRERSEQILNYYKDLKQKGVRI